MVLVASSSLHETIADLGFTLAFLTWNLLPVSGATVLLLWAGRRGWLPYAAATLGCVALAGLTAWALYDFWTSDSSTAALMFIFLPLSEWIVVLVGGGLVALANVRVGRRAAGPGTAGPADPDLARAVHAAHQMPERAPDSTPETARPLRDGDAEPRKPGGVRRTQGR